MGHFSSLVLFTPYVTGEKEPDNPLRAHMQISAADKVLIDSAGDDEVEVFDEVSQRSYVVRRADCGGQCRCASEIVRKGTRIEKHY